MMLLRVRIGNSLLYIILLNLLKGLWRASFKKEIEAIDMIIKKKKIPRTCIIGGSKISTKIKVIINLIKNVDNIVVVGAMANNFLLNEGLEVGNSIVENDSQGITENLQRR